MMKTFISCVALACCLTQAKAATISAFLQGAASHCCPGGVQDSYVDFVNNSTQSVVSFEGAASIPPLYDMGFATVGGSLALDADTGEIKIFGAAERQGFSNAGQYADGRIFETFLLNGSGVFSILMLLDASWGGRGTLVAQVVLSELGSAINDTISITFGETSFSNLEDKLLEVSVAFDDATDLPVTGVWVVSTQVSTDYSTGVAESFIDVTNTGTIYFTTTGSLVATPSSPTFLSNPAYLDDIDPPPSPIPLPASAWLLGAALLGLRAARATRA